MYEVVIWVLCRCGCFSDVVQFRVRYIFAVPLGVVDHGVVIALFVGKLGFVNVFLSLRIFSPQFRGKSSFGSNRLWPRILYRVSYREWRRPECFWTVSALTDAVVFCFIISCAPCFGGFVGLCTAFVISCL